MAKGKSNLIQGNVIKAQVMFLLKRASGAKSFKDL